MFTRPPGQCYGRGVNVVSGPLFYSGSGSPASDARVSCGHRLSRCCNVSICVSNRMVSYAAPSKWPNVFSSARYGVTRATGSDPVVKWRYPPYHSLDHQLPYPALILRLCSTCENRPCFCPGLNGIPRVLCIMRLHITNVRS